MAVLFKRFDRNAHEYNDIGVVINREYYGDPTNPVQGLNFDFDEWEDELVAKYDGKQLHAVKIDDDEIDIDEFRT